MRAVWSVVLLFLLSVSVYAEPSVWEQAARPRVRPRTQAIAKVDRLLAEHDYLLDRTRELGRDAADPTAFRRGLLLERARKMLENVGAARSDDPNVRFRLAQVYDDLFGIERQEQLLQQAALHFDFVA